MGTMADHPDGMPQAKFPTPTPDEEALQEPTISPTDIGNIAKMAKGVVGGMAGLALAGAIRHEVYDPRTGERLGHYATAKRAARVVDKRDLEYGAARYQRREINVPDKPTKK